MLHRFEIAGRRLPLFQRKGESFRHVAMKALCYGLFVGRYPNLEVERSIGGRYTPDLISVDESGRTRFWGECGTVSMRKAAWLAKHSGATELAFVKLGGGGFAAGLREVVEPRYRPAGRIAVFAFREEVLAWIRESRLRVDGTLEEWYRRVEV